MIASGRFGAADEAAFADVYAHTAPGLRRTAYSLCNDWHRAEDLMQTCFTKLYVSWGSVDRGAAPAWLRTCLVRAVIDESRRPWRRERSRSSLPEVSTGEAGSDDRLVLIAALAVIPARRRACLVLRYVEDLSVEQTAAAMGCSVGTVKSTTARGLADLRTLLSDIHMENPSCR